MNETMDRQELVEILDGVQIMRDPPKRKGRRSMAEIAADDAMIDWLHGLMTDPTVAVFMTCRDLGHPGKRIETAWGVQKFYRRRITCTCGMSYEQNVHNGRVVWKGNASYPTGYLKDKGTPKGHINPDVWRILHPYMSDFEFDDKNMPVGLLDLMAEMGVEAEA